MKHKLLSTAILLIVLLVGLGAAPPPQGEEITCQEAYTIQADDWLSQVAAKFLGDMNAYPAIVAATNQKQAQDASFAEIADPNRIEVGWKVCIPPANTAGSLLAETNGQITVVDALERTTQFEQLPQRIAVAGKATFMVVDALFMFPEALDRVKSMPGGGQSMAGFLSLVDPNFAEKPKFDDNPGPEQIAAVQPDAVVLKSFMADRLGQPLEQLGIPVVYVHLETIEQYSRDVNILGNLFDNRERAEAINAFYRERLERIDRAMSGVEKPRVLLLQYSDRGGQVAFNVPSAGWIQTDLVRRSGGEPVWIEAAQGGGWTVVGFEQIAAWEPDKIFVINYFGDADETVATLQADPRWQALAAVEAGELYAFPQDFYSWDQPDPRWILGLTWLAHKTHPDRLPDLDIMAEVDRFYQQLYGLDEAAIQETIIPKLGGE